MLQLEHDTKKQSAENDKQLEIMHFEAQQAKLAVGRYRPDLFKSEQLKSDGSVKPQDSSFCPELEEHFYILYNLILLPKSNENAQETFFSLFDHVTDESDSGVILL